MTGYREVTTVVDGAEEDFSVIDLDTGLDEIVTRAETIAQRGRSVQVYTITHDHRPSEEECACVQYLTDHHPDYSFNERD